MLKMNPNTHKKSSSAQKILPKSKQEKRSKHLDSIEFKESLSSKKKNEKIINIQDFFSQNKLESTHFKIYKDSSIECLILDYRINVKIASCLKIPDNAIFPLLRIERRNKQVNQQTVFPKKMSINLNQKNPHILNIRDIESQTYASVPFDYLNASKSLILDYDIESINKSVFEKCIEDLIFCLFISNEKDEEKSSIILVKKFISSLEKLSQESIVFLTGFFQRQKTVEAKAKSLIYVKNIIKLNTEKLNVFDILVAKLTKDDFEIDLEKLIKQAQNKQKDVRFETSQEKKKASIDRFKRVVRFIICNREWVNQFNKEKIKEKEKLLLDKYDNDFLDCKKIGLLFNKDEFKAQKSLNNLISDTHRNILLSNLRTPDQIEILIELVHLMPRINTFPKHVWPYVAQLMKLLIYEKGREIVRDGHRAIGYYIILNGSCDVISGSNERFLKIEEFEAGDTFGDNSFFYNTGITPYTVITNRLTELLVVEPAEIEIYLDKLRIIEKEEIYSFASMWWPFKYWNWNEQNFREFANKSEFLRFNSGEIVHDDSIQHLEKIFFVLKGKIQFVRLLDKPKSVFNGIKKIKPSKSFYNSDSANNCESISGNKKYENNTNRDNFFLKICVFEKYNFFGMVRNSSCPTSWFIAEEDDVNVVRISKETFLSLHKHSCFLLSQLIESYKLAIPDSEQCRLLYKQKLFSDFYATKHMNKSLKSFNMNKFLNSKWFY